MLINIQIRIDTFKERETGGNEREKKNIQNPLFSLSLQGHSE